MSVENKKIKKDENGFDENGFDLDDFFPTQENKNRKRSRSNSSSNPKTQKNKNRKKSIKTYPYRSISNAAIRLLPQPTEQESSRTTSSYQHSSAITPNYESWSQSPTNAMDFLACRNAANILILGETSSVVLRDARIEKKKDEHVYLIDGKIGYISCTSFIRKNFDQTYNDETASKFGIEQKEAGTKLHLNIQKYYNGIPFKDTSIEFKHFKKFVKEFPMLRPYRTEWSIFDTDLLICGTADIVFTDDKNEFHLYDWKRSNNKTIFSRDPDIINNFFQNEIVKTKSRHIIHALQLNIYKYILEKNYGIQIKSMCIVILHPENSSYTRHLMPSLTAKQMRLLIHLRKDNLKN